LNYIYDPWVGDVTDAAEDTVGNATTSLGDGSSSDDESKAVVSLPTTTGTQLESAVVLSKQRSYLCGNLVSGASSL